MNKQSYNVIPFQRVFPRTSPIELEEILEWLQDNKYLTDEGEDFRLAFWKLFIEYKKSDHKLKHDKKRKEKEG